MNNFNKLLENDLTEIEEPRVKSTVSFTINVPIVNYKDKGSLDHEYAKRDDQTPVLVAIKKILKASGLKVLPLSVNVQAFFKQQTVTDTIFNVHVEGGDENFLISILDLM